MGKDHKNKGYEGRVSLDGQSGPMFAVMDQNGPLGADRGTYVKSLRELKLQKKEVFRPF